ncbi:MAG: endopeptidase La, partial [Ruminococcaceae bacterium]|nr:endopeptidase La [Oscillospiraceae bacterium]
MEPVTKNIPALALRGLVVFPRMSASFDLERIVSMRALERAMETDQELFVVTQRDVAVELPQESDLYIVGTLVHITQVLRVSDHVIRIIVEGKSRARLRRLWQREPFLQAQIELLDEPKSVRSGARTEALLRQTYANFGEYVELTQNLTAEILATVFGCTEPGYLADFVAQHVNIRYQDKQLILDELRPLPRLKRINEILRRETEVIALEQEIEDKVRSRVGRIHRDFVLREQIKVLQNELGEGEGGDEEIDEYREHILALKLPE